MKETQKVLMTVLLVGLSLVTVAAADPTMSVSQQPGDVAMNDTFTAEVTVNPAGGEIYAASYDLYFDATILEAIGQTQGDFLSQGGAETLEYVNEINNTRGKITYVETRTGDVGGATEPGPLASITFKVIGTGISDLTLDDVQFDDLTAEPEPTPTPEPSGNGGTSSHRSSGGSSGYALSVTTPTATLTETPPPESATSTGENSSAIEDSDALQTSGESDLAAAESAPTAASAETPVKKTPLPSRPMSAIPGFAAAAAILCLLAVAIILKSRGK